MRYDNFLISGFSDEIDEKVKVQFETIQELGIGYFEPRGINGKNIADLSDDELEELLELMNMYGVKASSIGSPIGKINITEDFEPHFAKFQRVVEIAKTLGAKYIRIFSFYIPQNQKAEDYYDEVVLRLEKLRAYAEKENVILLHENEKDIYGDTIEHCVQLFEALHSEHFKAVFDPANFVQCGQDTKEAFSKLEPYIAYMHIKDATKDGTVVPAGAGDGNIAYLLNVLKEKGYVGFLSLEPHLGSFSGLENLEIDDAMTKLEKSSKKEFAYAYEALQAILERM